MNYSFLGKLSQRNLEAPVRCVSRWCEVKQTQSERMMLSNKRLYDAAMMTSLW